MKRVLANIPDEKVCGFQGWIENGPGFILTIMNPPEWVEKERRVSRKWVPDPRCYDTNENPLPKNAGFMGLVPKGKDENGHNK